jgi:hypothetical protein
MKHTVPNKSERREHESKGWPVGKLAIGTLSVDISVPARRVWQVRYHGSVNRNAGMDVESNEEGLLEDLHIEGVAPIVRRHVEAYAAMKGIKVADALMLLVQAGYDYLTPGDMPSETVQLHSAGAGRGGKKGVRLTFLHMPLSDLNTTFCQPKTDTLSDPPHRCRSR